jgi:uncharacterized membrane protein YcgQ (UPF0703/DUF1980 family)
VNDAQRNGAGTAPVDLAKDSDVVTDALVDDLADDEGETDDGSGAGETSAQAKHDFTAPSGEDMLVVGDKMFVGQMNDIYLNPENYIGRAIRYEGFFTFFDDEDTGQRYNCVVRNGPGCCGYDALVGLEVEWQGEMPQPDDWCSVEGTIDTYAEGGADYIVVRADALDVMPYRGEDTVTQ